MSLVKYDATGESVWDPEPVEPRRVPMYPEAGLQRFHEALLASELHLDWLRNHYALTDDVIRERQIGLRCRGDSMFGYWFLIPVRRQDGELSQVIERHAPPVPLPPDARKYHAQSGWGIHLYPVGSPLPDPVVICSGMFDQMTLDLAGLDAVTSTGGCDPKGWPATWLPLFHGRRVAVLFDRGEERKAEGLAIRLQRFARSVRVIRLPPPLPIGTDVTDLARERGHDWIYKFVTKRSK